MSSNFRQASINQELNVYQRIQTRLSDFAESLLSRLAPSVTATKVAICGVFCGPFQPAFKAIIYAL